MKFYLSVLWIGLFVAPMLPGQDKTQAELNPLEILVMANTLFSNERKIGLNELAQSSSQKQKERQKRFEAAKLFCQSKPDLCFETEKSMAGSSATSVQGFVSSIAQTMDTEQKIEWQKLTAVLESNSNLVNKCPDNKDALRTINQWLDDKEFESKRKDAIEVLSKTSWACILPQLVATKNDEQRKVFFETLTQARGELSSTASMQMLKALIAVELNDYAQALQEFSYLQEKHPETLFFYRYTQIIYSMSERAEGKALLNQRL